MSGYMWAQTPGGELFVVLMVDGKGYVPGVENAIEPDEFFFLGPVQWPTESAHAVPPSPVPLRLVSNHF